MHFEIFSHYHSNSMESPLWYWRLKAKNGKVIADGSEGYATASSCRRAIRNVMKQCMWIDTFPIKSLA